MAIRGINLLRAIEQLLKTGKRFATASASGRFVKQKQWEQLRAKRKLVPVVQAPEALLQGSGGYQPGKKMRLHMQNPAI